MARARSWAACVLVGVLLATAVALADGDAGERWVGTWSAAPQLTEPANLPPAPGLGDTTLRQVVHVSIGGQRLRVRFSNAFGNGPLTLLAAHVARSAGGSAIEVATGQVLAFHGRPSVTIPAGALVVSDPLDFELRPLSEVAVTVSLRGAPPDVTGHPGSRTTSYLRAGSAVRAADLPTAARVDHWYFLSGIEVAAGATSAAVAILGDSITDGRGSTTNGNDRWPDDLARRLQASAATREVAVLNQGIGGNRLLRDGLGPSVLARLDRDVLAQPGVRWLVVLEGINDLGTRLAARERGETWATADEIVAALEQVVVRAHARGLRVYGATILPYEGAAYFTPDGEADRQAVNAWIRTSRTFDGVIDFDAVARDPEKPKRLSPKVDGGDHLHPSAAGYRMMADAVDLGLFVEPQKPAR